MQSFSLTQISVLYLAIIAVLGYLGFKNSARLGAAIGTSVGEAAGSAAGAVLGVFLSYHLYDYARKNGMISNSYSMGY